MIKFLISNFFSKYSNYSLRDERSIEYWYEKFKFVERNIVQKGWFYVKKKKNRSTRVLLFRVEYLNRIFELLNGLMHIGLRDLCIFVSQATYSRRDIQITELYTTTIL